MATRSSGTWRWICVVLVLLVAVLSVCNGVGYVHAESLATLENQQASGHRVEMDAHATQEIKTKITITRTRVATTIQTAGRDPEQDDNEVPCAPVSVAEVEQCRVDGGQWAESPADAMPDQKDPETEDDDHDHDHDEDEDSDDEEEPPATTTTTTTTAAYVQESQIPEALLLPLEMATRHLEELQQRVRIWLPQLKAAASSTATQAFHAWASLKATWLGFYSECVAFYDRVFADAVASLVSLYHQLSVVFSDSYAVVISWLAVRLREAHELWQTHEEVRIVTHHFVAAVVLAVFAALFFSLYALVATVPDALLTLWTSLDDLTRAQLKIVALLVLAFVVYHLRVLWSFWLLVAAICGFYYWSGHVVAKHRTAALPSPPSSSMLQRQASRDQVVQDPGLAKRHY